MPRYDIPIPQDRAEALVDRTPERIHDHLAVRGLAVDGIAVMLEPPTLRVYADRDPTAHLEHAPWPTKRDRKVARDRLKEFAARVDKGENPNARDTMLALRALIEELARD